jgi:hypothetical protein
LVVIARGFLVVGVGAALVLWDGAARAENLDAGKSAPALFASTCQTCHASPRGLAKNVSGLTSFLQEHYTASPQSAAALAAYLTANAAAPAPKQAPTGRAAAAPSEGTAGAKRRPGQTAEPAAKLEPASPPQTATARPDSMIEPVGPRRHHEETKGAKGKRQPGKQETTAAPAPGAAEPPPAAAPAPPPPAAAPVAAAPPPSDQPAFSAPSP